MMGQPPHQPEAEKLKFRSADKQRLLSIRESREYEISFSANEPLVSIIIPTYERAELILERTLPSVLTQDYDNWEVVIIGDGMEESQANVLQTIRDKRMYFYNLKTRGNYPKDPTAFWYSAGWKPANFGLRIAKGQWITPLDDDDEFTPTHISSLLDLARRKHVEWTHGRVLVRGRAGGPDLILGDEQPKLGRITNVSSLYHRGLKTFRYNPRCWRYGYPGDWDLWERFLDAGVTHAHLEDMVAIYHAGPAVYEKLSGELARYVGDSGHE